MKNPPDEGLLNAIARGLLLDEIQSKQKASPALSPRQAYAEVYREWVLSETLPLQTMSPSVWSRMAEVLRLQLDHAFARYCGKRLEEVRDELGLAQLSSAEIERLTSSQPKIS